MTTKTRGSRAHRTADVFGLALLAFAIAFFIARGLLAIKAGV